MFARVFGLTDVGRSREHNEDSFLVADLESGEHIEFDSAPHDLAAGAHGLLFLVADGMGGAASGELASSMASAAVIDVLRQDWKSQGNLHAEAFAAALRDATVAANGRIHHFARTHLEHRGMGTTATIAGLFGDTVFVAQVGDSRAYLLRDGQGMQLTKDQSLMQRLVEAGEMTQEQAEASDRRNIILQALGPEPHVTVDLTHQQLRQGDTLLLCSDGLSGLVKIDEMAAIASQSQDVRMLCQRLIDQANARGGHDNITVIAASFHGDTLYESRAEDVVGYNTYALAGTLNFDTTEAPIPPSPLKARPRSEPPSTFADAAPTAAALEEEFARARAAEDEAMLGAPEDVVQERRRQMQPIYVLLAVIAMVAAAWLLVRMLKA